MFWASVDTQWGTMDSSLIVKPAIYAGLMLIVRNGSFWAFIKLKTYNVFSISRQVVPSNVLQLALKLDNFFTKYDFLTFTP